MQKIFLLAILILIISACSDKIAKDKSMPVITGNVIQNIDEQKQVDNTQEKKEVPSKVIEKPEIKKEDKSKVSLSDKSPKVQVTRPLPKKTIDNYEKICSKITFDEHKNQCYTQMATRTKDVKICEKIEKSKYDSNLAECYANVAYATVNKSMCDKVSIREWRNYCFIGIASKTEDVKICNDIEQISIRNWCISELAQVTKDVALCEKISTEEDKISCFSGVAQAKSDPEICNKIPPEKKPERNYCRQALLDKHYYRGSCLGIGWNLGRDICFNNLEKSTKDMKIFTDLNVCEGLNNDLNQLDWCLIEFAYNTGEASYCDKAEVTNYKELCIRAAVAKNRNLKLCYNLTLDWQKNLCLVDYSTYENDLELCRTINTTAHKDECLKYIAIERNDPKLCLEINTRNDEVRCLNHVARATYDYTLCDDISWGDARSQCYIAMFLPHDNWDYDCGWVSDWPLMNTCFFAKEKGIENAGKTSG